jgi:hypothetical protein
MIKEKYHSFFYLPLISHTVPLSHEPDPDYLGRLGDKLQMVSFESNTFNSVTKPNPDPNEVKQGAVGTCPLIAVLVATAHVASTKKIIVNMIKEKKLSHNFNYLTLRTREIFEYRPLPQDYNKQNTSGNMDFDYRTWEYLKDKKGNNLKDDRGQQIRKTKKEFLVFLERDGDYQFETEDVFGTKVEKYVRKTKDKEKNKRSGPIHFFDPEGNLHDEILPLLPHDLDPINNFINKKTVTLSRPGFRNKRWFTVKFRNPKLKEVAVTPVLYISGGDVHYASSINGNLWPSIIEKAYVAIYGKYPKTGGIQEIRGDVKFQRTYQNLWYDISPEQAMEDVVGPSLQFLIKYHPDWEEEKKEGNIDLPRLTTNKVLKSRLQRHDELPTIVATLPKTTTKVTIPGVKDKQELNANHTFAVIGYNRAKELIQLRDAIYPTTITIRFKDLRADFYVLIQPVLGNAK